MSKASFLGSIPRRSFVAACAGILLAACASMRTGIKPPDVTVESVRVGRIAEAKADISLKLALANPNDVELAIDRMEFDVTLDGRPAVTGRTVHVDPLPPGGQAKVDVAGRVDISAVATALMTLGSQLPVPYAVNGAVTFKNGTALSFSRKGELPVLRYDGTMGARP
jgi:LEA14-like dessication related protein